MIMAPVAEEFKYANTRFSLFSDYTYISDIDELSTRSQLDGKSIARFINEFILHFYSVYQLREIEFIIIVLEQVFEYEDSEY